MTTYEKLTLKYRPKTLDELFGQDSVVNTVRGMLTRDCINRTILISGPYGSGKTSIARMIATYVNCEGREPDQLDPCGKCDVCKRMQQARPSWMDYREQNAADARGINDIRALRDQAKFKPQARFRVFVLDEVHQLTPEAAEALLKILEEPPSNTIFILCTTNPHKLPNTIVSRCCRLTIKPVESVDTVKILSRVVKGEGLDEKVFGAELLTKIATSVDGHPRDAIETLESVINNIAGRGGLEGIDDIDSMILDIAEEVVGETPEKVAAAFLLGVYKGKFTGSLLALRDVTNYQVFVDTLLHFHNETMNWRFSAKLQDKMMFAWYKKLKEQFGEPKAAKITPIALADIMDVFLNVSSQLKSYTVDGHYALVNTAVRTAMICKGVVS